MKVLRITLLATLLGTSAATVQAERFVPLRLQKAAQERYIPVRLTEKTTSYTPYRIQGHNALNKYTPIRLKDASRQNRSFQFTKDTVKHVPLRFRRSSEIYLPIRFSIAETDDRYVPIRLRKEC